VDLWLRNLGSADAVRLARELIFAEAGRLNLPLGGFQMSGRVNVGDEGIDGRTNFPDASGTLFPTGRQVWQVKSGTTEPRAADEFKPEHEGLLEAVRSGWAYVLFWTNDPEDPRRKAWMTKFREDAQKVVPGLEPTFLLLEDIERLANQHPAALMRAGAVPHYGVLSLETWGRSFLEVEFVSDDQRDAALEAIGSHLATDDPSDTSIHIFGDTGVGKSRVVYEALNQDGRRERTVVAPSYEALNQALLTHIAETENSDLVLVVDDCTRAGQEPLAVSQLCKRTSATSNGRESVGPATISRRHDSRAASPQARCGRRTTRSISRTSPG
jgi:hypothetical protein